ncbi:MAG: hypothetical protein C4K49_00800 [Candidatus Thorarchaeota archaeon]|nr:MAG: hypothetical protein C4K49_00800 [Candidatus Thorarchaeota archaeon]
MEGKPIRGSAKVIDTHCHLESEEFQADLPGVIERATSSGVWMITSGISPSGWPECLRIVSSYPSVYAAVGLEPDRYTDLELALAWIHKNSSAIVAVGETGLDHYLVREHEQRLEQEAAFRALTQLAIELRLPVQVHSRSAGRRALEVLAGTDAGKVHMHAFDGKASLARDASRNLGYYFSVPTSVVRSPQKRKLVKAVEYERLLLETDSPVLGADSRTRNEPANVWIALREVASILGRDIEEVRLAILENTRRLYPLVGSKE